MDIIKTDTKLLKVADLRPNEGQIPDVPSNPRFITESEYEKLCNSLREDNLTGVLQVKVYNYQGEWIVLDGNMRLKAMQEVGIKEAQCLVVPQDAPAAVLRKIVIEANSTFGRWDTDMLANEWDADELDAWGVSVPKNIDESEVAGLFEDVKSSNKSGEQTISIVVPTKHDDNIEDIKSAIRITLQEWDGCKVR